MLRPSPLLLVSLTVLCSGIRFEGAIGAEPIRDQVFRFSVEWEQVVDATNEDLELFENGSIDFQDLHGWQQLHRYGELLPTPTPSPTPTITPTPTPTATMGPVPALVAEPIFPDPSGRHPSAVARSNGDYYITYDRSSKVRWVEFNFDGSEEDHDNLQDDTERPDAAEDNDGKMWIVYQYEDDSIFGFEELRLYHERGDYIFYTVREDRQRQASIAIDGDGIAALVWEDEELNPDRSLLRFARYSSSLEEVTFSDTVFLSEDNARESEYPDVAVNSADEFLAVWVDDDDRVKGTFFTYDDPPEDDLLISAEGVDTNPRYPRVAALLDDYHLAVWEDHRDDSGGKVYGRLVDGRGDVVGEADFRIDSGSDAAERPAATAFDQEQLFLVVWAHGQEANDHISGVLIDTSGNAIGAPFVLVEGGSSINGLDIAASKERPGDFVLVWEDDGDIKGYLYSISF